MFQIVKGDVMNCVLEEAMEVTFSEKYFGLGQASVL